MKTKISGAPLRIIALLIITATMTYANNKDNLDTIENKSNPTIDKSYQNMSTAQLQNEVEKRSINGDLSFAMGLELMKRWTKS